MLITLILGIVVLVALFAAGISYVIKSGKKQRIMQETLDKLNNK